MLLLLFAAAAAAVAAALSFLGASHKAVLGARQPLPLCIGYRALLLLSVYHYWVPVPEPEPVTGPDNAAQLAVRV
jgi:hypothetical protein